MYELDLSAHGARETVGNDKIISTTLLFKKESLINEACFSPLCPATASPPMQRTQVRLRNHSMVCGNSSDTVLSFSQLGVGAPPANLLPAKFLEDYLPCFGFYTPLPPPPHYFPVYIFTPSPKAQRKTKRWV